MVSIFIIFLVAIFALIVLLALAVSRRNSNRQGDGDEAYYDEEGHHAYYDRSIIEKEDFAKEHPEVHSVRTFRRLFSRKK